MSKALSAREPPASYSHRRTRTHPALRLAYPLQPSASVGLVVPLDQPPAAVQTLADGHDTPDKIVAREPVGLGVCWIDHVVPFQRPASVTVVVLVEELPTAAAVPLPRRGDRPVWRRRADRRR